MCFLGDIKRFCKRHGKNPQNPAEQAALMQMSPKVTRCCESQVGPAEVPGPGDTGGHRGWPGVPQTRCSCPVDPREQPLRGERDTQGCPLPCHTLRDSLRDTPRAVTPGLSPPHPPALLSGSPNDAARGEARADESDVTLMSAHNSSPHSLDCSY